MTSNQKISLLNDETRLSSLAAANLMDTLPEPAFDRATRLAQRMLGVPVTLFSIVDGERQFFKSHTGLEAPLSDERQTPLSHSFCQHVVDGNAPLRVVDARDHETVRDNLAIRDMNVIAYLGVPVRAPDGMPLGSFCAISMEPREWSAEEEAVLRDLAHGIESELTLREEIREREATREKLVAANERAQMAMQEAHHRVKNSFAMVSAIVGLSGRSSKDVADLTQDIQSRISALSDALSLTLKTYAGSSDLLLASLVTAVVRPYDMQNARIAADGPKVAVPGNRASGLALVLHECVTNAVKYGALKDGRGRVDLSWQVVEGDAEENPAMLDLEWREACEETVEEPETTGFGTRLIDRIVKSDGGEIVRDWRPYGLAMRIRMPLG